MSIDETDRRLLSLLRTDGRLSASSLAAAIGVSRGTVQNRIDRLTRDGVIQGFTVRLKPDVEPDMIRAIMLIEVEGKSERKVLDALRGYPEVRALHTTNGRWDIVAEVRTTSLEAFDEALRNIRLVEGVANTETNILLATQKM